VNKFTYSGFYIRFSLEKLNELNSLLFGVNTFNLFSFYEKDHGYRDGSSLEIWANDILGTAGINNFSGSIVLQAFPRIIGYVFNPVCFWYCYDGDKLIAIICEVNNTFGESHSYVIKQGGDQTTYTLPKEFHVSPFYDINGEYKFDFTKNNTVKIDYYLDKKLQLCTGISGEEIPWNDLNLLKTFFQYPFYTVLVIILIHYQALKLFFKKNKYFSKPIKLRKDVTYDQIE
jgi:hypothetical protein